MRLGSAIFGCIASSAILLGTTAALAKDGAAVATDKYCRCPTCSQALGNGAPTLETYDAMAVETPSGGVTVQCHFDIPKQYAPKKTMKTGTSCRTRAGETMDGKIVLSPGGRGKLTCQYNPSGG